MRCLEDPPLDASQWQQAQKIIGQLVPLSEDFTAETEDSVTQVEDYLRPRLNL